MLPALPTGMKQQVGRVAEGVDDLEGGRLLALDAVRVDGVHERDRVLLADVAREPQGVVEVAADVEDARAVGDRLGQLALRDVAVRDEDVGVEAAVGGVGGGGSAGVAGRGAEDGLGVRLEGLGDGDDHAAVFERARGVAHLELEVELAAADALVQAAGANERRVALAERDERVCPGRSGGGRRSDARTPSLRLAPPLQLTGGSGRVEVSLRFVGHPGSAP